ILTHLSYFISHVPEILQPYILKVVDVKYDGHCVFQVFSYCLGCGQHDHLAVRNKLYEDTKERGKEKGNGFLKPPKSSGNDAKLQFQRLWLGGKVYQFFPVDYEAQIQSWAK
ncbi:hypothetical protein VP01_5353g1, partial [Puccinia sorghi]